MPGGKQWEVATFALSHLDLPFHRIPPHPEWRTDTGVEPGRHLGPTKQLGQRPKKDSSDLGRKKQADSGLIFKFDFFFFVC